ncbi:hypothetical protein PV10_00492 [Exophiala mesophila]|uniref:F-box domain-containing protein n=1 Tax=Exophiala mesophila TaxID=212818 RepID=A0A0D1ZRS1_EXOME|nr:uncharacterized protein PV10_00492 [Exophiala mesophila]KIV96654.1 hypothetical protein PV10_00492 [Exophiala mesophila]
MSTTTTSSSSSPPPTTLLSLPAEVIQTILFYLPPTSTISVQLTCRRLQHIATEPLLWKDYCRRTFRWWDARHSLTTKLADPSFTAWKQLFATRAEASWKTRSALDNIINDQVGRLDSIQRILEVGYDAKDDLSGLFWNAKDSRNYLAQRYWCHAVLGCLHRLMAVEEWLALRSQSEETPSSTSSTSFERPLAALDLFILEHRPEGDIEDIYTRLNSYVDSVRTANPTIDTLPPRQQARLIATHLLEKRWIGIQGDRHYHSLDHMFLGVALFSENRNSVPLVSVIIFCYVARAFGLRAVPCSYPFHVHALVQGPLGFDLDGNPLDQDEQAQAPSERTHLYMDPFNNAEAISLVSLEAQLKFIAPNAQTDLYLSAASPRDMTVRTAHNILSSPSHYAGPPLYPINPNLATYAALFALVLIPHNPANHAQLRQHMAVLTQHFLEFFDLDIHIFETRILPLTASLPDARAYRNLIHQLKDADHESKVPKYRSDPRNDVVKFSVGQVFRHRRRSYLAVIYGWDPYCRMQEQWITVNHVDSLPQGRHQPFYNVLVEDESTRYVAEENIVLLKPEEITNDMIEEFPIEIGKWFKRFDYESGTFVSNVTDEYPED